MSGPKPAQPQPAALPVGEAGGRLHWQRLPAGVMASALAADLAQRLRQAIAERGRAVLSVSGGKSPIALFEALRTQPLDWSRVHITLVDERCVPSTHEASNARLVREHLLQGPAASAHFVPMVPQAQGPLPSGQALAEAASQALQALGPADVLLLGMGADGHTASLFPDADRLPEALDLNTPQACLPMALPQPPANAPFARITQTLAQLLRSRHLVLPLAGADKLQTLRQALAERSDRLPVSHLLHQDRAPLSLWITE